MNTEYTAADAHAAVERGGVSDQKPTNVAETLRAARAVIAEPEHWTKGAFARPSKSSSKEVPVTNPEAGAWCALGALRKVDGPYEWQARATLAKAITNGKSTESEYVWKFNDASRRRHPDILDAFDRAIALAEVPVLL